VGQSWIPGKKKKKKKLNPSNNLLRQAVQEKVIGSRWGGQTKKKYNGHKKGWIYLGEQQKRKKETKAIENPHQIKNRQLKTWRPQKERY